MDYQRRPEIHVPSGVVVRLPESEDDRVPERQAGPGRCTGPFVPWRCLCRGRSTFLVGLRLLFILIHTCFRLRPPLCGNGDERKASLTGSLLNAL
jgi:hypothetical protein